MSIWHHEGEGLNGVWHYEGEGHVKVGDVIVADVLVLAMRSIHGMQNLLIKANAQRKRYLVRESKTTVQIINSKYQSKAAAKLLLNGNL